MSEDIAEYAGEVAGEIDRLVVAAHGGAFASPDKPDVLAQLKAHPALLNTVAVVMLSRAVTREELGLIQAYTPPQLTAALIDNNISEGVVEEDAVRNVSLTVEGRAAATAVVELQEFVVDALWAGNEDAVTTAEEVAGAVLRRARDLEPPTVPSAFAVFASAVDRPTPVARALRIITALRYWRADAHRAALAGATVSFREAHALNRLWDDRRGVTRVGQGFPEPGSKGVADLEARSFAENGAITVRGVELREAIELQTNEYTAPIYTGLDATSRERLLQALKALPG